MVNQFRNKVNWRAYYQKIMSSEYNPDYYDDGDTAFMELDGYLLTLQMQENGEFSIIRMEGINNYESMEYERTGVSEHNGGTGVPGQRKRNGNLDTSPIEKQEQNNGDNRKSLNGSEVGKRSSEGNAADNQREYDFLDEEAGNEPAAFYLYYQGEYGAFSVFEKLIVDMDDEQIAEFERVIDSGIIGTAKDFISVFRLYKNGQRTMFADNIDAGYGRKAREIYGRWLQAKNTGRRSPSVQGSTRGGRGSGRLLEGNRNTLNNDKAGNEPAFSLEEKPRMSVNDTDAAYLQAIEQGDMETAQKMLDEAAKKAGYNIKAYHGTPYGGFTVFKDWQYFTYKGE